MVDKDNPRSWRPFRKALCRDCMATCCTIPLEVKIEDLIRLGIIKDFEVDVESKKEIKHLARKLQKSGLVKSYRDATGLFLIPAKANGDCFFLDENRRCKVYENRPTVCREFPLKMGLRLGYCPYIHSKLRK